MDSVPDEATAYATKAINNLKLDYVHMLILPRFRCEIAAAPRANRPARDGLSRVTYYTENSALSPSDQQKCPTSTRVTVHTEPSETRTSAPEPFISANYPKSGIMK